MSNDSFKSVFITFLFFLDPDGMGRKDSIGQARFTGLTAPVKEAFVKDVNISQSNDLTG